MGRRKIEIQPITHERNRSVTFLKRKNGLFKKAYELGVLCSVDVAVIIFEERPGHHLKLYQYCSSDINNIVQRHLHHDGEKDTRGPNDFSGNANSKAADMGDGDDDDVDDDDDMAPRTLKRPRDEKLKPPLDMVTSGVRPISYPSLITPHLTDPLPFSSLRSFPHQMDPYGRHGLTLPQAPPHMHGHSHSHSHGLPHSQSSPLGGGGLPISDSRLSSSKRRLGHSSGPGGSLALSHSRSPSDDPSGHGHGHGGYAGYHSSSHSSHNAPSFGSRGPGGGGGGLPQRSSSGGSGSYDGMYGGGSMMGSSRSGGVGGDLFSGFGMDAGERHHEPPPPPPQNFSLDWPVHNTGAGSGASASSSGELWFFALSNPSSNPSSSAPDPSSSGNPSSTGNWLDFLSGNPNNPSSAAAAAAARESMSWERGGPTPSSSVPPPPSSTSGTSGSPMGLGPGLGGGGKRSPPGVGGLMGVGVGIGGGLNGDGGMKKDSLGPG
ncbi:unnamed protein product [Cyclocybe aegerita]|uniref:MADS-box domain-containing protein n=1 Tax=Cyclocybe aegerita TaxID=1973307 RepID=A0A8S0VTR5_CYCAE|nr:unnamed protein product [Cyclocybe aegerita]